MHGHAVDGSRVDHHGQRTGQGSCLERLEVFLTQHLRRDVGWRAVFAGPWCTVGEIMLGAGSHMIGAQVVGVVALIAFDFGFHHTRINYGVLAKTFPNTSPARITAEVDHGIVYPRAVSGTALVGGDLSTGACV